MITRLEFANNPSAVLSSPVWACCLVACVMLIGLSASAEEKEQKPEPLSLIHARNRSLILDRSAPDTATIQGYQKSLQRDGSWLDVEYQNRARINWLPGQHLQRIEAMALAYAQAGHKLQGDKTLLEAIYLALDYWLANSYTSLNWWHNVIQTPRSLGTIAVLIDDKLVGDRRKATLEAMEKCPIGGSGANLMDQAQIVLARACLADDKALLEQAVKAIACEIRISQREGIQEDWSYHQHGACSQPLSYGKVYLSAVCDVGWILRGTPYEFPVEKRAIISMFILNGIQWMTRGTYTAPSTMDRQVSRPNALKEWGDFRDCLQKWIEVATEKAPELNAFLGRQNGVISPLSGFRHFYRSDLSVYQRPGFALFLKTRSKRVMGTEGINDENLKGQPYLHTGDHYSVMDGGEYTDMPPVWDWSRLPGLTMFDGIKEISPQVFVGGLGNGESGLTVMDYSRDLSVRKFWAFHGDLVICLLGGWQNATARKGLRTTLDQCALDGPVLVRTDEETKTLNTGVHGLPKAHWVLHKGIGYVPLHPASLVIRMGEATGMWRNINKSQSGAVVKEDVFTCDLMHGDAPVAGGFMLAPGITVPTLIKLAEAPPYHVIQNDGELQCILFDDGTYMAAFYKAGQVTLSEKTILSVDAPCLALWSDKELLLCDPGNRDEAVPVKVIWQGRTSFLKLPAGGKTFYEQTHIAHPHRPSAGAAGIPARRRRDKSSL